MSYDPENAAHRQQLAFDLTAAVIQAGFERIHPKGTHEMVYAQPVAGHPDLRILVYTSIVQGQVRKAAKDAIRVTAVYTAQRDGRDRGVVKATRVHRTGEIGRIVDRCLKRITQVQGNVDALSLCPACNAPKFQSKNKNWVCAELCWLNR